MPGLPSTAERINSNPECSPRSSGGGAPALQAFFTGTQPLDAVADDLAAQVNTNLTGWSDLAEGDGR